jgi:hypothetical protein
LNVSLIDTPGLNDPAIPDIEVLNTLVAFLADDSYHVVGVVYLHAITDKKITGTTRLSLRLLREICGEHFYQNIVLVTSMWDTVPHEKIPSTIDRESQLQASKDFWGDMIPKGSRYMRWSECRSNDCKTAMDIVKMCRDRTQPPKLKLSIELKQGACLEETSAGNLVNEEIRKRSEQTERALQEELQAAKEDKRQLEEAQMRMAGQGAMQHHNRRTDSYVEDAYRPLPEMSRKQSSRGDRQGKYTHSGSRNARQPSHRRESARPGHSSEGMQGGNYRVVITEISRFFNTR